MHSPIIRDEPNSRRRKREGKFAVVCVLVVAVAIFALIYAKSPHMTYWLAIQSHPEEIVKLAPLAIPPGDAAANGMLCIDWTGGSVRIPDDDPPPQAVSNPTKWLARQYADDASVLVHRIPLSGDESTGEADAWSYAAQMDRWRRFSRRFSFLMSRRELGEHQGAQLEKAFTLPFGTRILLFETEHAKGWIHVSDDDKTYLIDAFTPDELDAVEIVLQGNRFNDPTLLEQIVGSIRFEPCTHSAN